MTKLAGTLVPPTLASAPSSPVAGQMYYDTGTNLLYFYNGSSWVACGGGGGTVTPAGIIETYVGDTAPSGYLMCDGSAVSRTTYAALFAIMVTTINTFTVTIASPGVFTTPSAHGLVVGDTVYFETTGALPTGLTADQAYDVTAVPTSTTFRVTASVSIVNGVQTLGADVNTSGTQSGTHTLFRAPFAQLGAGKFGATTFQLPDLRGQVLVGKSASGTFSVQGLAAGEATHVLTAAELAAHDHNSGTAGQTGSSGTGSVGGTITAEAAHTHPMPHTHSVTAAGTNSGGETMVAMVYSTNTTTSGTGIRVGDMAGLTGATGTTVQVHSPITTQPTFTGSAVTSGGVSTPNTSAGSSHTHAHTLTGPSHTHALATVGSNTAHQNLQPFTVANYIVKT